MEVDLLEVAVGCCFCWGAVVAAMMDIRLVMVVEAAVLILVILLGSNAAAVALPAASRVVAKMVFITKRFFELSQLF